MTVPDKPTASGDLLEKVAHITELRDRESLGVSLVSSLHELIDARQIKLYKLLTDRQGHRLLQLVARMRDDVLLTPGSEGQRLLLERYPEYRACIEAGDIRQSDGARLYPVHDGRDVVCGLLEMRPGTPDGSDERLITAFLRIYRNYIAILDDSERDTLTGLLNRKTFDRNITRMLNRQLDEAALAASGPERRQAGVEPSGHWLAVMDVDHFKRINDRFGHLYGDEVLLLLAQLMQETFRHHDRLFRFGGEEFVVLLETADFDSARKALDRFRKRVEGHAFPQVGKVTISVGFAAIRPGDSPSAIIGHADAALYYAKEHGRNRVCSYERLLETGEIKVEPQGGEMELF